MRLDTKLLTIIVTATIGFSGIASASGLKPFFYQVTKAGKTSFILGTIHGGVSINEFPVSIKSKIRNSSTILAEQIFSQQLVDLTVRDGVARILAMIKHFEVDRTGQELTDQVRAELVDRWKVDPRLAEIATSKTCMLLTWGGLFAGDQLDHQILKIAYDQRIQLVQLDKSLQQQINEARERGQDDCDLVEMMKRMTPEAITRLQSESIEGFKSGDEARVTTTDPDVVDRNRAWIPVITRYFELGNSFAIMGAAHLAGPGGVPALLSQQGFEVRRIDAP